MNIRLYNARILTMEKNREIFRGEVQIRGRRIEKIIEGCAKECHKGCAEKGTKEYAEGDHAENPTEHYDLEMDCEGNLLMPGFKDAHTHSPMTFLRSFADDLPLQDWLEKKIFPMEAKLTPEAVYAFGKLAVLEYLSGGITGIFDMYLMPDVMAQVCLDMGMRCVLVSGLNNFTSSLDQVEREFRKWNEQDSLISYRLGFHAEYTTKEALLKGLAELSHKYGAPVFTHLCETGREVTECVQRHGMTPAAYLDSLGLFDYGGGGFHCVHMSEPDLAVFERRRLFAVTNPAANLKLASGIAPLAEFCRRGIPVAIGTDGPAGNNCLDMFREMFLASGLAKVREEDATCMPAREVLRMATVGSAGAMGLSEADILAPGKLADLIMIDLATPNMQPIHDIPVNLVYSGSKTNVKMTMIDGKIRYLDGEYFVGSDPRAIYEKSEEIIKGSMISDFIH